MEAFFFKYSLEDFSNCISKAITSRETDRLINSVSYSRLPVLSGRYSGFEFIISLLVSIIVPLNAFQLYCGKSDCMF